MAKAKYTTPAELRDDNQTPLDLSIIGDFMTQALDSYVEVHDFRAREKSAISKRLIQAGTHAIPISPRQTIHDEIELISQREKGAEEMLKIVKATLKLARKTKLKRPEGKRLLTDGISLKEISAIQNKAKQEYGGDVAGVIDPVRCTLLAKDSNELQLLSEIFRPCSKGALMGDADFKVIRYRNEFNRVNPEKAGIRRLQVNVRMPKANGLIGEILVFYGPSSEKYDLSRAAYGEERSTKQALQRAILGGQHGHGTVMRPQRKAAHASSRRRKANDEAADFPEVRSLVMNQRAYLINDFPVIVNDDAHKGQLFALVPNPASGYWETDQRFLDIIENPDNYPDFSVDESDTFEARIRGEALCRSPKVCETLIADIK